ncbi:MAG: hypothetical protein AB1540_12005 [Bdellovibrionota bacterium]
MKSAVFLMILTTISFASNVQAAPYSLHPRPIEYEETFTYYVDACNNAIRAFVRLTFKADYILDATQKEKVKSDLDAVRRFCLNQNSGFPSQDKWQSVHDLIALPESQHLNAVAPGQPPSAPPSDSENPGTAPSTRPSELSRLEAMKQPLIPLQPPVVMSGLSWQTQILDGLAKFIVDSAKTSITRALLDVVQKNLCKPGLENLTEHTCSVLSAGAVKKGRKFSQTLQSAVSRDLEALLGQITASHCEEGLVIATSLVIGEHLEQGAAPLEVLGALSEVDFGKCEKENPELVRSLKRTSNAVKLFVRGDGVFSKEEITPWVMTHLVNKANEGWDKTNSRFTKKNLAELHTLLIKLSQAQARAGQESEKISLNLSEDQSSLQQFFDAYVRQANSILNFTLGLHYEKNTNRLARAREFLKTVEGYMTAVRNQNYGELAERSLWVASQLDLKLPEGLERYLPLLADLASVRAPEDLTAFLNQHGADYGAVQRRRRDAEGVTLSIGAYVGIGAGGEAALDDTNEFSRIAPSFGLTAPVGIEVTKGLGWGSIGGLFTVFDLGSLASVRFPTDSENNQISPLSGLNPQSLVSPGACIVMGITENYPISLLLCSSLTPGLRDVKSQKDQALPSDERASKYSLRAFGAIATDVPLLEIGN